MSINVRGTIAVLAGCLAAATGATPAFASANVPIEVPLGGVESALHTDLPELRTEAPVPIPGAPEGPSYSQDHVLPQHTLPRLPVSTDLPATEAGMTVPQLLPTERTDRIGLSTEGSPVHTLTPGASVNPPLSGPRPERLGLPQVSAPQAALGAPDVQAEPGADLAMG
ncbi:hypothetical protein [Streptomyces sp. NPDC059639]|uniref:hypothetical protein n=1 Tax=Streptomyces sp. NPDC059639 TaxID=3346891 RepID=UPI0036842DF1